MQGLLDCVLRDILTRVGGVDLCVGEFIRVTHTLLNERTFLHILPELAHGGRTPAGVPRSMVSSWRIPPISAPLKRGKASASVGRVSRSCQFTIRGEANKDEKEGTRSK